MNQSNPALIWRVHGPQMSSGTGKLRSQRVPSWLNEIWALRGYVLYNHGERPQFKVAENLYTDPDPADFGAYHLLAYSNRKLVGCVRLLQLGKGFTGVTESFLGKGALEQLLLNLGTERAKTIEGGRWMAHPDYRQSRLGVFLACAAGAMARHLGYHVLFCPVGTKDKQNRVLARLGLKPAPGVKPFYCETFVDTLQVMYFLPARPTVGSGIMMDTMARTMGLAQQPYEISPQRLATVAS
jgi:hypothetical protein